MTNILISARIDRDALQIQIMQSPLYVYANENTPVIKNTNIQFNKILCTSLLIKIGKNLQYQLEFFSYFQQDP